MGNGFHNRIYGESEVLVCHNEKIKRDLKTTSDDSL
jgi:hypothetical protein